MKRGGNTVFSWCRRIVCFSADGGASHPLPLAECLGEAVVTAFDYDNDAIGRRTARLDALPGDVAITNAFGYNMRSEVTQANMGINIYGYVFDPIGNRITATNNAEVTSYVANELNQYTNILCASAPLRDPSYDSDGNMTTTGDGWHYVWNGENRLVIASNAIHVVSYAYDHRGRMVRKNIAPSNASPSETIRYLWDDFNIIAETVASDSATNTTYNVWGLDLDGMLQGAGGVGGLLAVVKDTAIYIPAWDANGNIMEYVAEDGSIVAHREYDPFGGTVVATGDAADFTHWFSTKPWCGSTGLSEYQFRKYSPVLGRWLSRDPIGEEGGLNINSIARNDVIGKTDYAGLIPNDCCPEEAKTKYYECLAAVEKWSAKRLADAALVRDTALSANQSAYESLRDGAKVEGDKCRKKCQDQFGNSFAGSSCIFLCDQAEGAAINVVYAAYVLQRGTIYATYGGLVAYVELSAKNQRKKCEDDLTKECPYENKK